MTEILVEFIANINRLIDALDDHRDHYEALRQLVRAELDRRSGQTSLEDYCE